MATSNKAVTLKLYRHILFAAKHFPSIKRNKIVEEIKLGFRENKNLKDAAEIQKSIVAAQDGLSKLLMYTSLRRSDHNWEVSMEQQPMPKHS